MYLDPQTPEIRKICESLIGCKINIGFTIALQNGKIHSGKIENCNIIGDCMENILFPFIKEHIPSFEKGPKQASPDFYNSKIWEWELKCFSKAPCFDISNFNSYVYQLENNLKKKMFQTQYLIFQYSFENGIVLITNFKLCNVWEILNYKGKYPISLQCKKGIWYNIRPCSFNDMNTNKKPSLFIKHICRAISETPNKLKNKQKIINTIYNQFYKLEYSRIIESFDTLSLLE